MKLNNKGFLITGILYSLLLLFLVLIIGMIAILSARQNKINYITKNIITKLNDKYDLNVAKTWEFDYTGDFQTFTVPASGYYQVELWGAKGAGTYGGKGAYTRGTIYLTKGESIYIYVGNTPSGGGASYNGGGKAGNSTGYSGGGATDVRTVSGTWDNFDSLKSRLMVAAGGGGMGYDRDKDTGAGAGGNLKGLDSLIAASEQASFDNGLTPTPKSTGATQTSGGIGGRWYTNLAGLDGTFAQGGSGQVSSDVIYRTGPGGGGGYYGGASGTLCGAKNCSFSASGGSSFISGYYGCDAIADTSTATNIIHTGQSIHYSGRYFINALMIDGVSDMPSYGNTVTMHGNDSNGYAKISLLNTTTLALTLNSFTIDKSIVAKSYVDQGLDSSVANYITVPAKIFDNSIFINVFHHNTNNNSQYFSNANDWFEARNSNTEYKRSILFALVNNEFKNGSKYEFMLEYPDESTTQYNRWEQIYSPIDILGKIPNGTGSETAQGYVPIHIDWGSYNWGGLTLSTSSSAYIDGAVGHSNWFYAIAPKAAWVISGAATGVPTAQISSGRNYTTGDINLWSNIDYFYTKDKKKYTLTNMIANGSFENSPTSSWVSVSNATIAADTTNRLYGATSLSITPTNSSLSEAYIARVENGSYVTIDYKKAHKYYCKINYLSKDSPTQLYLIRDDWQTSNYLFQVTGNASSIWSYLSLYINNTTLENNVLNLRLDNNNNGKTAVSYFDGFLCVDLTESFGSGNEPDQDWCNENISYFDGTIDIYK